MKYKLNGSFMKIQKRYLNIYLMSWFGRGLFKMGISINCFRFVTLNDQNIQFIFFYFTVNSDVKDFY